METERYADPQRPGAGLPVDEAFAAVATFASERAAELYRVLSDTDGSTPVWTWTTAARRRLGDTADGP